MSHVNGVTLKQQKKPIKLSTYHIWISFTCLLCVLIISPIAFYLFVAPSTNRLDTKIARITATQVADGFKSQVSILRSFSSDLRHHPELIQALQQNDLQAVRKWEDTTTRAFSVITKAKVVLPSDLNHIDKLQDEIGFADYDAVVHVSQKDNLALEVHYHGTDKEHLQITRQIRSPSSEKLLGVLLLDLKPSLINDMLKHYKHLPGYFELRQSIPGTEAITLFSVGDEASRIDEATYTIDIEGSQWDMVYWQKQGGDSLLLGNMTAFGIAIGMAIFVFIIGIIYSFKRFDKAINNDLSILTDILYAQFQNKIYMPTNTFKLQVMADYFCPNKIKKKHKAQSGEVKVKEAVVPEVEPTPVEVPEEKTAVSSVYTSEDCFGIEVVEQEDVVPQHIFRAYDIRGVVGETLTEEAMMLIGQALGSQAKSQNIAKIAVGRDGRVSGPSLSESLVKGLTSSGVNVLDIGPAPTPVVYYVSKEQTQGSGAVLTGSHNPADHNGLKMMLDGTTLAEESIYSLHHRIAREDFSIGDAVAETGDFIDDYIQAVAGKINVDKPLKVVVDCGNGITGLVAPKLYERLGCTVIPLYEEVDGNFPNHHPDPSRPENLNDLIDKVAETNADLGLAFDGDGDRLGVVTNTGQIIWPDQLLMIFSKQVLAENPGATIIYDVKCSRFLEQAIHEAGGEALMWKTGHSLIKAKIKETGAVLAGEMSGHFFFNDRWYGFDDGLYAGARLLELLSQDLEQRTLQDIYVTLPTSVATPELNIDIAEEKKYDFVTNFEKMAEFPDARITNLDGIRVDFQDGWGLLRPSNTTPKLVLRFEADNQDALNRIVGSFKDYVAKVDSSLQFPII